MFGSESCHSMTNVVRITFSASLKLTYGKSAPMGRGLHKIDILLADSRRFQLGFWLDSWNLCATPKDAIQSQSRIAKQTWS
eukprot:4192459-Amphidinium_carterae.2